MNSNACRCEDGSADVAAKLTVLALAACALHALESA